MQVRDLPGHIIRGAGVASRLSAQPHGNVLRLTRYPGIGDACLIQRGWCSREREPVLWKATRSRSVTVSASF